LAVLRKTQRDRWIAHTLAGLADVSAIRGDTETVELLAEARERFASTRTSLASRRSTRACAGLR